MSWISRLRRFVLLCGWGERNLPPQSTTVPGEAAPPERADARGVEPFVPAASSNHIDEQRATAVTLLARTTAGLDAGRRLYFAAPYVAPARLLLPAPRPPPPPTRMALATATEGPPLSGIATARAAPRETMPGRVTSIEPIRFTAFAVWPKGAAEVPSDANAAWLLEPALLSQARRLRDAVLHNHERRQPPLRPASFFEESRRIADHAGTALLLCHAVAKAFARGREAITWRAIDRRRGAFSDGAAIHKPMLLHPEGVLYPPGLAVPTMYYLLFSAAALGTADTGDWYRFFALATLAALSAAGGCVQPQVVAEEAALSLARCVDAVAAATRDPSVADHAAYRAWRWANALSFAEWTNWGRSQRRAAQAARSAIAATSFGLAASGCVSDPAWRWWVPRVGRPDRAQADQRSGFAEILEAGDGVEA
jgi:hypothetical protein